MADFEANGLWWFSETPEKRYSGNLEFNNGRGASVTWMRPAESLPKPWGPQREFPFFYGTSTRCKAITLYRCIETPTSFSGPLSEPVDRGIERQGVFAYTLFVGGHLEAEHLNRVVSISTRIENIPSWPGKPPLSIKQPELFSRSFSVSYEPEEPLNITINENLSVNIGTRIAKGLSDTPHRPLWNISLQEELWVSIRFNKPTTYANATLYLRILFDFFAISSLTAPRFSDTTIEIDDFHSTPFPLTLDVYDTALNWEAESPMEHGIQMLFNQKKAGEHLPGILANWVNNATIIEGPRNYYMSALYGPKATLESNFLMLCSAAESIHRILYPGKLLPDQQFDSEVLPVLRNSIPQNIASQIRASFCAKLAYLNEFSLNQRLKELWRDNIVVAKHYSIDGKRLANLSSNLRNGLTHISTHTEHHEPISDYTVCSNFLRFLIELSFLKLMGFPVEVRQKLAIECYMYKWIFK